MTVHACKLRAPVQQPSVLKPCFFQLRRLRRGWDLNLEVWEMGSKSWPGAYRGSDHRDQLISLVGESLMGTIMGTLRIVARPEHQAREVAMFIPPHATLIVTNKKTSKIWEMYRWLVIRKRGEVSCFKVAVRYDRYYCGCVKKDGDKSQIFIRRYKTERKSLVVRRIIPPNHITGFELLACFFCEDW